MEFHPYFWGLLVIVWGQHGLGRDDSLDQHEAWEAKTNDWNQESIWGGSINGGYPKNGWFIREHPIKMDDLEASLFQETPIWWITRTTLVSMNYWTHEDLSVAPMPTREHILLDPNCICVDSAKRLIRQMTVSNTVQDGVQTWAAAAHYMSCSLAPCALPCFASPWTFKLIPFIQKEAKHTL